MATQEEIESWVKEGESETQEFKATTNQRREAAKTLCGMLNHRGGRVLFGVTPEGTVRGQHTGAQTIEEVVQEIKGIDPPVFPTIERVTVGDGYEVISVSVLHGPVRPYTYKGKGYRRVGSTTQELSKQEYNQMLLERLHGQIRWENEIAESWSIEDLDISEITRTVEAGIQRGRSEDPGTRDPETLLRGLSLMRDETLLRAAVVLFGLPSCIEAEYPQCMLRVARFHGTDRSEFLDNRQFHGHAFELLGHAERFLRSNLPIAGQVLPGLFERMDDPLYPLIALREALANAFCHRDYSIGGGSVAIGIYDDRLEITSSGTLHFGLTAKALFEPHESLPWNPLIARVFYRRGLIESWGRGTLKILELVQKAGLPQPEFEDTGGCVTIRFRPASHLYSPPKRVARDLTDRQQNVLAIIEAQRLGVPLREIRKKLGAKVPEWEIKEDLAALKHLGLLKIIGHGRGAYWKVVKH